MKYIVYKATKPINLVVNSCAGTYFIAEDSTLLYNCRRSIGCKVDPSYVTKVKTQLIMLYV